MAPGLRDELPPYVCMYVQALVVVTVGRLGCIGPTVQCLETGVGGLRYAAFCICKRAAMGSWADMLGIHIHVDYCLGAADGVHTLSRINTCLAMICGQAKGSAWAATNVRPLFALGTNAREG